MSQPSWTAFRSLDYGYTILKAHNETTLEFSQISDDKKGAVIDNFFLIKDNDQEWYSLDNYELNDLPNESGDGHRGCWACG